MLGGGEGLVIGSQSGPRSPGFNSKLFPQDPAVLKMFDVNRKNIQLSCDARVAI